MGSINTGYTLQEAKEMLSLWKACYKALAEGHAKHYRVGTREFTAFDLDEVERQVARFANMVDALSGRGRTVRVTRVVPRDL